MASKSITIDGTIIKIGEVQTVGAKGFQKREVIVEIEDGKYPQTVPIEFTGDKINEIDGHNVGDAISVDVNLRGRSWTGPNGVKYFLSLSAWKINGAPKPASRGGSHEPAPTTGYGGTNGDEDRLPF